MNNSCNNKNIYEIFFKLKNAMYVERDTDGNILYPTSIRELKLYREIINTAIKRENQFYHLGTKTWYKKTTHVTKDSDGQTKIIDFFEDITDVKEQLYNLRKDALTNLISDRNESNRLINEYIQYAAKAREEFSIVMADLDYFKDINDTYGHDCGDYVLKNIGKLLLNSTKQSKDKFNYVCSDIVVRFGGDEFLILLKNTSFKETCKKIASIDEKVKKLDLKYENEKIPVGMSFGYYHVDKNYPLLIMNPDNIRKLISKKADAYLYLNKNNKKSRNELKRI